ncbi:MAG: pyridoxal-phosphate dependent enzyme [Acidimicrobiia bacterium]|nr:pyridoxal-phosphate dependent enzyme [Acidimicrobiia bacterium]
MRVTSVLDLIGNTPLVDVSVLSPNPRVRILAKLEGQNPTGSVKDRVGLALITDAERRGLLPPGATLMEPTSGNTGISMAMVCRLRGYELKAVVADNVSAERVQLLRMYGAEIVFSPGDEGSNGAVRLAQRLVAEHGYVFLNQYENEANVTAHYTGTGPEIWRDCPEITAFVAGLGTGGTLTGCGRYLKEQSASIQVLAAEPPAGELVQGLRSLDEGYTPPIFDPDVLDGKIVVRPLPSVEWARRILAETGIFSGLSCGAAMLAAARHATRIDTGTIVVLFPDGGWKYLSTGAWLEDLDTVGETLGHVSIW